MLYRTQTLIDERNRILSELEAGTLSGPEAAARMLELDPEDGAAYTLRGQTELEAGDEKAAMASVWEGITRAPLSHLGYLVMGALRLRLAENQEFGLGVVELACRKVYRTGYVPEGAPDALFPHLKERLDLDFDDPDSYLVLAEALRRQIAPGEPAEVTARLFPYRLLDDFEAQAIADEDPSEATLDAVLKEPEVCSPVWHAALRELGRMGMNAEAGAAELIIAMLGEIGPASLCAELLEIMVSAEQDLFLHTNWALIRLGKRFPDAMVAAIAAATPEASLAQRCGCAEQLFLLPATGGVREALLGLLENLPADGGEDAAYLLLAAIAALVKHGYTEDADRISAARIPALGDDDRSWLGAILHSEEGFVPRLVQEELDTITLRELYLDHALLSEEDDETPPEDRPERNDPCWCGSGLKYKKCHLESDQEYDRSAPDADEEDDDGCGCGHDHHRHHHHDAKEEVEPEEPGAADSEAAELSRRLAEFAMSAECHRRGDLRDALGHFLDDEESVSEISETLQSAFIDWFTFVFRAPSTGRTAVEQFLRRRAGVLSEREKARAEAMGTGGYRILEVQGVNPGVGLDTEDLFTGERFPFADRHGSRKLVKWDCILAHVSEFAGSYSLGGTLTLVPRSLLEDLRAWIDGERREKKQSASTFVREHFPETVRWVVATYAGRKPSALVNAEGDPLEFCRAHYEMADAEAVAAAFAGHPELEDSSREGDDAGRSYEWLAPASGSGEEGRRAFGHIEFHGSRLRLECNSPKRLERGRALIEGLAGGALKYLGDSVESVEAAMKRSAAGGPHEPSSSEVPKEVAQKIIADFKAKHYSTWPDIPLPALGGKTPRQASLSKSGKAQLEALLRDMENQEQRDTSGAPFDFSGLRRELGLS